MTCPEWFYKLTPLEQKKQLRRWRYYRMFYRRLYGDSWQSELAWRYA